MYHYLQLSVSYLQSTLQGSHGLTKALGHGAATLGLLGEQGELTLLGHIASLAQALDGLLASSLLTAADDASALGLHQVLLGQATGSMLGGSVEDLGLGASRLQGTTLLLTSVTAVLTRGATSITSHFYLYAAKINMGMFGGQY